MRTRILIALLALVGLFLACLVPTADEVYGSGKKSCDETHLCIDGYECQAGLCVEKASPGTDAGSTDPECTGEAGAAVGTRPFCAGDQQVRCQSRRKVVLSDCAQTGMGCDPTRGCLAKCASGCPSGTQCDQASDLCVAAPACAAGADGGCASGETCTSGACLTHPASGAFYLSGDTQVPAAVSCFARPADVVAAGMIAVSGRIRTAWNQALTATDGQMTATLTVFKAADFESDPNPIPSPAQSWTTTALQNGGADTSFSSLSVPADTELVARVEGPGLVPTYQYFRVPSGSTDEVVLSAYDRKTWNDLLDQAELLPRAGRAMISGTVRDCTAATQAARGVAAGLAASSPRAYYTYPDDDPSCAPGGDWFDCLANFPLIDLDATLTGKSGRFFIFDVPALKTELVLDPGAAEPAVVIPVRTVQDSVLVLNMRAGAF